MHRPTDARPAGWSLVVAVLLAYVAIEVAQVGQVAVERGWPSPWALSQVAAIGALALAWRRSWLRFAWSPVLTGAMLIVAAQAISVPNAADPAVALDATVQSARDVLTLVLALALLETTGAYRVTAAVCAGVLAVLAGLSVLQEFVPGIATDFAGLSTVVDAGAEGVSTARHAGPIGDPNFWARLLVVALPFAVVLAVAGPRRHQRLLWAGAAGALLAGVVLTQSRGGLLAVVVAVVVVVALGGARTRRRLVVPALVILVVMLPVAGARLETLWNAQASATGEVEESLALRIRTQRAGLQMVLDHPFTGVGAGNYELVVPEHESRIEVRHLGQVTEGVAAHNAFLEAAAETGMIGLVAWILFLGSIGVAAVRAWLMSRRRPGAPIDVQHLLAAAGAAGLAGWIAASTVLHVEQFRALLVFAAIIAALDLSASRAAQRVASVVPRRRWHRGRVVLGAAAAVGMAIAGWSLADGPTWEATATVSIAPRQPDDAGLSAYQYDLLSRPGVMRTMALVMSDDHLVWSTATSTGVDRNDVHVGVDASSTSSVVELAVSGRPEDIALLLPDLAAAGAAAVNAIDLPFVATVIDVSEPTRAGSARGIAALAGGVAIASAAGAMALIRCRDRFARPRDRDHRSLAGATG